MTQPYDELANIYDNVMHHVHYRRWAGYLERLFSYHNAPLVNLIDLSCGTGKHLRSLKKKGRNIYGSDLSLSMLRVAKNRYSLKKTPFICADFSAVPFKNDFFDVVLILYDSINYVIDDNLLHKLFGQVKNLLKDDGLFIFDVVTPFACEEFFLNYTEADSFKGVETNRHSWYRSDQQMQYNEFIIKRNGNVYTELHQQKIRKNSEWEEIIRKNNFELIHAFNNFTFVEATPYSERVHFVCQV
jgi:SAM-dependent methyltransferase